MANICTQLRTHFPIVNGGMGLHFSSDRHDFKLPVCWRDNRQVLGFEQAYAQTRLPLEQRVLASQDDPQTFRIDGLFQVSVPTSSFAKEAVEFWKGRKTVALLSATVVGALTLAALIAAKPTAALIAMTYGPSLGLAFAVAAAALIVFGAVFALYNYVCSAKAQKELNGWEKLQGHIPHVESFPQRIARIRARIFATYRSGWEIVADLRNRFMGRYFTREETHALLSKSIERAFPDATDAEKREILLRKRIEYADDHNDRAARGIYIWDYEFPQLVTIPMA